MGFLDAITGKKEDQNNGQNQNNQNVNNAVAAVKQVQHNPKWSTRMGQCDPPATCEDWMLSCFCFHCASAAAKSKVDLTHPCYNCLCWQHIATNNWIRRAYRVDGTCGDDMMCGLFCTPCTVRRFYTEVNVRGQAPLLTGGPNEWKETLFGCGCCEFFQAILCPFCVVHNARFAMQPNHTNPDSCFDCLCILPFSMYGQVRHMYGIQAEFGIFEDLCLPIFCFPCALTQAAREANWRLQNCPQVYAAYGVSQAGQAVIGKVQGMLK